MLPLSHPSFANILNLPYLGTRNSFPGVYYDILNGGYITFSGFPYKMSLYDATAIGCILSGISALGDHVTGDILNSIYLKSYGSPPIANVNPIGVSMSHISLVGMRIHDFTAPVKHNTAPASTVHTARASTVHTAPASTVYVVLFDDLKNSNAWGSRLVSDLKAMGLQKVGNPHKNVPFHEAIYARDYIKQRHGPTFFNAFFKDSNTTLYDYDSISVSPPYAPMHIKSAKAYQVGERLMHNGKRVVVQKILPSGMYRVATLYKPFLVYETDLGD